MQWVKKEKFTTKKTPVHTTWKCCPCCTKSIGRTHNYLIFVHKTKCLGALKYNFAFYLPGTIWKEFPSKLMDWGGIGRTVEKSVKIKHSFRASRAHVFIKATTRQKNVYIPFKMECLGRGYNNSSCQFRKRWCYWQLASKKCILRRYLRRKGQRCLCTCLWVCALQLLMVNYVCEWALQIKVLPLK